MNIRKRIALPKETLSRLYIDERLSIEKIAKLLGIGAGTVHSRLVKYDIPRRKTIDYPYCFMSKPSWSKGRTKQVDERLNQTSRHVSETRKRLVREGKLTIWNKGLSKTIDARVAQNAQNTSKTKRQQVASSSFRIWNRGLSKETDERIRDYSKKLSVSCLGRPAWTKGLTKETDPRIAAYATKLSAPSKANWKNNEYVKKQMVSRNTKPNKLEKRFLKILNDVALNQYGYVGDGTLILGGKCPDFMNVNGQKKLIELFGDYWHEETDIQKRIDHFKQFGFSTLIVWEHELKDVDSLKLKLTEFNGGFCPDESS